MTEVPIPSVGSHRGVTIHAFQPEARIATVVKPAIDAVCRLTDPEALASFAEDGANPPEARLFAAACCEAAWELAAENRAVRPQVDRTRLQAAITGLDSLGWIDPDRYTSLLDHTERAPVRDAAFASLLSAPDHARAVCLGGSARLARVGG